MLYLKHEIVQAVKNSIMISDRALQIYVNKSNNSSDQFGTMLIRDGIISRSHMGKLISDYYNVSYIELSTTILYRKIFKLYPTEIFLTLNILPLYVMANTITMVTCDPLNPQLKSKLSKLLNQDVNLLFSFSDEIIFYLYKINRDILMNKENYNEPTSLQVVAKDKLMNKLANFLLLSKNLQ